MLSTYNLFIVNTNRKKKLDIVKIERMFFSPSLFQFSL